MRHVRMVSAMLLTGIWAYTTAHAHHAMEFIETESYSTIPKGGLLFYLHYDYKADDKNDADVDRWEFTPGISYGITDRLMVDIHAHYAKFKNGHIVEERQEEFEPDGPPPFVEAASFTLQYRVTEGWWLDVAVVGSIEVPFSRAKDLLDAEEVYSGALILSHTFPQHANITLNLIYSLEGGDDEWEYALGFKTPLTRDPHSIAAGIEWVGGFDDFEDAWSVVPGIYMPIGSPDTVLKTGIQLGKGMDETRFHVSLMQQF